MPNALSDKDILRLQNVLRWFEGGRDGAQLMRRRPVMDSGTLIVPAIAMTDSGANAYILVKLVDYGFNPIGDNSFNAYANFTDDATTLLEVTPFINEGSTVMIYQDSFGTWRLNMTFTYVGSSCPA